jgi:hypothetical protein
MLPLHVLARGAAHDGGIQHPTLNGEAAFGEMLPGMAPCNRRPVDIQLSEAGAERHKDLRMVTDDFLRGTPLDKRPVEDLDNPAEVLPVRASCAYDRPAIAVENQTTREPLALALHEIA